MTAVAHEIAVVPERRIGGETWYRAVCSCGSYRSGLHGYRGRAWEAGTAHVKAKAGAR